MRWRTGLLPLMVSVVALAVLLSRASGAVQTVAAQPPPPWILTFVDTVDPIALGATETWTLTATNPFSETTTDGTVTVSASFPGFSSITAAGTGWSCAVAGTTATCTRSDSLDEGDSFPSITYTGRAATCGLQTSTATVSGGGPSARTVNATTTVNCATLAVAKTDAVDPISIGQTETWTVTVSNTGNSATSGTVTVSDVVPSNFGSVAASGTGWSCMINGNTVNCTRSDTLAPSSSYPPVTITARAVTCGSVSNTASVSGGGTPSTVTSAAVSTQITCGTPQFGVTKTDAVDPLLVGLAQTWTVVVANGAGTSTAPSAPATGTFTITDAVPDQFGSVSASGTGWACTTNGNTVTCSRTETLALNASLPPITIRATAVVCGSTVTNSARLTFSSSTPTPGPGPVTPSQESQPSGSATTTILCQVTVTPNVPLIEIPPPLTRTPTVTPTVAPPTQAPATVTVTTPPATATATAIATATATATVTQPPATTTRPATVTATVPATTPATMTPGGQTPQGVQFQSGQYISGANPLREGQTTRVQVTYILTNNTNEVVDYSNTVVFDLAEGVSAAAAVPARGNATISARQVAWGGFALNPGESASITMTLDVTPSPNSAGRTLTLITGTTTTGRAASGGFVNVRGGGLTSASISGLANGGFVLAAVPAGGPMTLPRTGGGAGGAHTGWLALAGVLAVLGGGALAAQRPRARRGA